MDTETLVAEYGPDVPVPVPEEAEPAAPRRRRPGPAVQAGPARRALRRPRWPAGAVRGRERNIPERCVRKRGVQERCGRRRDRRGRTAPGGNGCADSGGPRRPRHRAELRRTAGGEDGARGPEDGAAAGTADRPAQPIRTIPYVRAEQEKRAATAQRQLDQLGKVNPLALEEYAALEERHQFLATQLEDLKKTRRDLLTVVKEVDDRVQQVFTVGLRGHRRRVRADLLAPVPRRRGQAGADRARRHAGHRHRRRGQAAGQEGQAALAAVRRRALADRDRLPAGHLQGPPVAVLRAGRGRGGAGRHQPAAAARRSSRSCAASPS